MKISARNKPGILATGFRRGGFLFPLYPDYIEIPDDEVTDDLRTEPALILWEPEGAESEETEPAPKRKRGG